MPASLKLVIGNKNYSSWSMRPWVLLRQAGIPFEEIQLKFDDDARPRGAEAYSPTRHVPVLLVGGAPVWDSLAICETVAELYPDKRLWPADERARALARSICAEMHAGFRDLRSSMPMNIRASHPGKGMSAAVRRDIDRVCAIWNDCRELFGASGAPAVSETQSGRSSLAGAASVSGVTSPQTRVPVPSSDGALLFGQFTVADAYYAPVVMRFLTYQVSLPETPRRYVEAVRILPAVAEWIDGARRETEFVAADEPYASRT